MQTCFKKWRCKNSTPSLDTSDQVEQISTCAWKIAIYFHDWNESLSLQACIHMLSLTRVWRLVYSVKIAAHIVIFRIWEAIAMGTEDPNRSWDQITGGFKIKLPFLPIIMRNQLQCVNVGLAALVTSYKLKLLKQEYYMLFITAWYQMYNYLHAEHLLKWAGDGGGSQLWWVCVGTRSITTLDFSSIKAHKGKCLLFQIHIAPHLWLSYLCSKTSYYTDIYINNKNIYI